MYSKASSVEGIQICMRNWFMSGLDDNMETDLVSWNSLIKRDLSFLKFDKINVLYFNFFLNCNRAYNFPKNIFCGISDDQTKTSRIRSHCA